VRALIVTATSIVALGWVSAAPTAGSVLNCQVKKLKAQGKLQACLKKNKANVLKGGTDVSAACRMKFSDALTLAGGVCRFLDNGDGTVTDLNTGLQWEKKDNSDGMVNYADPHDADNGYTWCSGTFPNCTTSANLPDGTAYTDFLATLNNGASTDGGAMTAITGCFAGHCDWRLPTIAELQDILELSASGCGSGSPCIDPALGRQGDSWSANTRTDIPSLAWVMDFVNIDGLADGTKAGNNSVRAVRGGL
jgi:hypothetical protein